jgi:diadenosine tetraphosphate (Ap4A) HIT family hydrolase
MANAMTEDYVFYLDANINAALTASPTTPGHTLLHLNTKLFVDKDKTQRALASAKKITRRLCTVTSTERCGLAYDGDRLIHILPLHGLEADWSAVLNHDEEFPGYLSTKNGPKLRDEELDDIRKRVIQHSGLPNKLDISFHGDVSDQNLFARIIRGELPQWRLWDDASHIAFLTPFANSPGYTVLVPRRHLPSDIFGLEDQDYTALVDASNRTRAACFLRDLKSIMLM